MSHHRFRITFCVSYSKLVYSAFQKMNPQLLANFQTENRKSFRWHSFPIPIFSIRSWSKVVTLCVLVYSFIFIYITIIIYAVIHWRNKWGVQFKLQVLQFPLSFELPLNVNDKREREKGNIRTLDTVEFWKHPELCLIPTIY